MCGNENLIRMLEDAKAAQSLQSPGSFQEVKGMILCFMCSSAQIDL